MSNEIDDFYADIGGYNSGVNDDHKSDVTAYVLIKVSDIHILSGFVSNLVVSLPSYHKSRLSKLYNAHKDVMLFFLTKVGDGSVEDNPYW